ncbi:TonB-dependent receptor [Pseudemcibacter aquimaris]|uniref:TonB-dependent receptor n=1 Tax=Pseudemcibacter aquimaris TaxID=2857064 RepID=UPI00201187EA|nr:TonB-dependent receptor [Pseudemcibacter aquimaris]MCC3860667.1 TonB-dependent receptor [Pseudemcibacter aquimaris]WDU59487.1 TonB-dependent receptor [Pseudemcibacter aquimaris]
MTYNYGKLFLLAGTALTAISSANAAQDEATSYEASYENVDKVVVFGRAEKLIGTADSASDGVVGYADFTTRPLLRVGELVEVIPGMVATQHSGSGKANQYFLRGFNLDHGTDFLATFEGMPINLPTHGHGQGYLDLNFIIPEVVETVEYRKGPYSTEIGDFSSAGSTNFNIYDKLDQNFAEINIGQNGYYRVVSGNSVELSDGNLLFAAEGQLNDGPWVLDDDLKKYNAIMKYSLENDAVRTELLATAYHSTWMATDQIPMRAVENNIIDEMGNLDDDLGGNTTRMLFSGKVETENLTAQVYGQYYDFNLFSNFTYFLDDPVRGDEFEQVDNRSIWGGNFSYSDDASLNDMDMVWTVGSSIRYDQIKEVGLYKTESRVRHTTIRNDSVDELAFGGYADVKLYLNDDFRVSGGVRVDRFSYDVTAQRLENSGSGNQAAVSPKISAAYRVHETAEIYANYGHGFHSNDVRGAAISVDPVSGDPVSAVPVIAKSKGAEIGIRLEPNDDFNFAVSGFWLDLDSELVFVGDAGATEVNDGSRRYGVEVAAFWQANDWLAFDLTAASTDAKFNLDNDNYIPGAVRSVLGAGATVTLDNGLTSSLRVRHFGSAPLIEDNSVRSEPTTLVNFGASYDFDRYTIEFDVFNVLNSNARDITYFYESQMAGEAAAVEDIHYHPVEPRIVRVGFKVKY